MLAAALASAAALAPASPRAESAGAAAGPAAAGGAVASSPGDVDAPDHAAAAGGGIAAGDGVAAGAAMATSALVPPSQDVAPSGGNEAMAPPQLTLHPLEVRPAPRRSVLVPALETVVVTGVTMAWNQWVGHAEWAAITPDSIRRNLTSPWVFDNDQYWINQFGHPYQGSWSYTAARSAGLSFWQSVPFTVLQSTFWEYAGETERPSLNDQVTTIFGGIILGETFFRSIGMLTRDRGFWRRLAAGVLSPVGAINNAVLGDWNEAPVNPAELRAWVGAIAFAPDTSQDSALGKGATADLGLRLVYGPGGDPDTRFEKPFDHFELEASYGCYLDPVFTLLARGLVFGASYEGPAQRGLWGMFVGFDMITPGRYRMSTSSVGIGTVSRFTLADELALDLNVVVSAVPIGVGGYVPPGTGGSSRDYHIGGGAQGVLDLRLRAGTRTEVDLGVRQYVVIGSRDSIGQERMTYATGGLLVRLFGPHALGTAATFIARSGTVMPEDPAVRTDGAVLRVFYAYAPYRPISPVPSPDVAQR
jgi:hypothetical protein